MARSHVVKVEASIKCGAVAQLGPRTLIVGDNGAGKSTIVNAIELAGTGRASDVAGRVTLAAPADLAMLLNGDQGFASVRLEGGVPATWTLEKGHRAERAGPEIAFPLRDVREALLGSAETARKWILSVAGGFDWPAVVALVPKSLQARLAASATGGAPPDAPAALVAALEAARKRVRAVKASVTAARSLPAPASPSPSDAQIKEMEEVIAAWAAQGAATALAEVRRNLAGAVERLKALQPAITDHQQALAQLPAPAVSPLLRSAVEVAEGVAAAKVKTCPLCGTTPADPAVFGQRAAQGRAKVQSALAVEDRRTKLTKELQGLISSRNTVEAQRASLAAEVARLEALGGNKAAPTTPREEAEAQLRAMHSLRAAWDAYRGAEERALEAEREVTEWEQLADALARAMAQLVEQAIRAFELRVQAFLPTGDTFGVDLVDGDREVLRVGLRRHGRLHPALSGAEWARVTAALALATAPADGPCVVCPEERAFDPATLTAVLEAFAAGLAAAGEAAPQIVVTSPIAPARLPEGWHLVELRSGGAVAALTPASGETSNGAKPRGRKKRSEEPAPQGQIVAEFRPVIDADGVKRLAEVTEEAEEAAKPPKPPPPPVVEPTEAVKSLFDD